MEIDEKHPVFANMEVKTDDVNGTFTVDYEITFDPEKGKKDNSPNNERQYEKDDPITLKEIKKDKSNVRVCEKCQKEFKAMGAEDKCDNCKDNSRERERERESKIEQLRKRIEVLEAIVNRTPQEEKELQNKKRELAELEREKQEQNPKKLTNWTPWLIGGVILVLVIITVYLLVKDKEKNSKID